MAPTLSPRPLATGACVSDTRHVNLSLSVVTQDPVSVALCAFFEMFSVQRQVALAGQVSSWLSLWKGNGLGQKKKVALARSYQAGKI